MRITKTQLIRAITLASVLSFLVAYPTYLTTYIPEIKVVDMARVKNQSKTYQRYEQRLKDLVDEHHKVLEPLRSELEAKRQAVLFSSESEKLKINISELELRIRNLEEDFKNTETEEASKISQQFSSDLARVVSRLPYQTIFYQAFKIDPKHDISHEVAMALDGEM